ncbi:hypothetical protein WR25_20893 isoform B [Diploscapter pachys]|nr:hypothetical protein WR25_20893 isoform B [Diploscapter pachys]
MGRDSREWSNSASTFVKITVSRTNVFEDSFRVIQEIKNPLDLRRQLDIRFQGEERLDYGDVAGEWFLLLSREVFNPMHRLFVHAGNNNNLLKINPAFVDPNCLKYFEFIGRFIAMALFHSKFVYSGFTMPFYKKILNKKVTLKDIEQVDPEFYNSVVQIKKNPIDRNQRRHFPGSHGLQIPVTDTNKDEYIDWLVEQQFNWGVERQTKAFFEGLNSVLPPKWLQNYDERKLELRLCGMQDVDVNDWEKNTIYTSCTRKSKQVTWFWQWVRSLNQEKRARLLQFVTGTCRVPVGGFSELMDSTGLQPFHIEGTRKRNGLPRSHTCSNTLYLPSYQSPEQLAEKLSNAIDNTEGFSNEE